MFSIYKREMSAYFTTPLGYIFAAVFLALSGAIFTLTTIGSNTTSISAYFLFILFIFTILIPLLTMKSFSEERKMKTEQILLTSPVSIAGMVFGKFLAAFTVFAGTFALSCVINFCVLSSVAKKLEADVPTSQIYGNFLGIVLIGAAFIAIGIFLSSVTENQLVAAIATIGIIIAMFLVTLLPTYIGSALVREVILWFSVIDRFNFFMRGIFSIPAIIYFISLTVVFLFLTTRVFESRRWN